MKRLLFILLIIWFISCNEDGPVNNGSDKTVIEKSLTPSNTEINLTTSDGINITIPAGALNSNLDIKVIKMANPPASTDTKLKIGNNIFKIALNGSLDFNDDIVIRIKYDKSKIQSGLTVLNGVFGIVFIENTWQVVDCEFDIIREEIVIKFNPQGKVNKFNDKLQEENSIIIGDGYSTTDTGQNDDFLALLQKSFNISIDFSGYHDGLKNGEYSSIHVPLNYNFTSETFTDSLKWNGNLFTSFVYPNTSISGSIDSKNKTLSVKITADEQKVWEDTTRFVCEIEFVNIPYDRDAMIFGHTFVLYDGQKIKNCIKSIQFYKTVIQKDGSKTEEEYKGTNFNENCTLEVNMMHK